MTGAAQTSAHADGPLDGHPEACAGLHKAVQGLEEQLAGVLAANLTPLSQEVVRLHEKVVALEAENRRFREMLEEAGLGHKLPPPRPAGEQEEPLALRRLGMGRRRRSRSPNTLLRGVSTGKPTLLATPELRSPAGKDLGGGKCPDAHDHGQGASSDGQEPPASSRVVTISVAEDVSCGGGSEAHPDVAQPEVDLQQIWKDLNNAATLKKGIFHRAKVPIKKGHASFLGVKKENLEKLILPPTSHKRMLWEAIGAIIIIYDLVTVPLQAFSIFSYTNFLEQLRTFMIYLHICYWTLDLPCSFFVGYYVNGMLETRVKKTAKRYFTTWFLVDICLVTCDWIMFFMEVSGGAESTNLSYLMYGRVLRLLRFVRLVRLLKLHNMFNKILESIHSEYVLTFLRVSEHVLLIVCLNHFIACAWYWIGTLNLDQGRSWIERAFPEPDMSPTSYRYFTSLHWSLTQFTPASMEVFPTNVSERSYNVVVVILAMVTFSTFISSITEAMTRLRKSNTLKTAQYQVLRQYLGENQVSMQLAMKVWRYLEHGSKARRHRKMWRDVELLREIPDTLQMDLHHEVYMPILCGHPFFSLYNEQSPLAMRAICHHATQEISLVSEQVLFSEGQVADRMFFIIEGLVEYQVFAGSELPGMWKEKHNLTYPDWLCEASIWVKWLYHGTATAKQPSSLLALNVTTLHSIMKEYVGTIPYNCDYAERFAEYARSHPAGICDVEEDIDKVEAMANEAFEHVESTLGVQSPNPEAGLASSSKQGKRRVTWGRRATLGSMLSGRNPRAAGRRATRKSGSSLSSFLNFLQGGPSSTESMECPKQVDARPASSAQQGANLGRSGADREDDGDACETAWKTAI